MKIAEHYRDGVGMERCLFCRQAIRTLDDAPVVYVRLSDLEEAVCGIVQLIDCPEVWGEITTRFEQACGRTVEQIAAAHLAKLQAETSK